MGICNFIARILNTAAPMLSEAKQPLPMIVFSTVTAIASILALFLIVDKVKDEKEEEEEKPWAKLGAEQDDHYYKLTED